VRLSDFVTAEHAVVPLGADTISAAADALLARLVAAGSIAQEGKVQQRLAEGRPEDIVAMGDRAFLLHYRTDTVRDLLVAVGTSPHPICRTLGENEQQCARVVLLILAPPKLAARYLQVVGAFARLLSKEVIVEQVLAQPDAVSLAALPAFHDHEVPENLTVREIMTEGPKTIAPAVPLKEAAREMLRLGIGGMPVVDDEGRMVGMLGERELMQRLLGPFLTGGGGHQDRAGGSATPTVRDAMNRKVMCVSPAQPLAEVASLMINKDVDRVPVVRDGRVVGLLTRGDIVRRLIGR
jgi:CBS domain-containing protein